MIIDNKSTQQPSWWRRVGWLLMIWCASVASLAIVAYVLKVIMLAVGMSR